MTDQFCQVGNTVSEKINKPPPVNISPKISRGKNLRRRIMSSILVDQQVFFPSGNP
jgi:hypothetical protein